MKPCKIVIGISIVLLSIIYLSGCASAPRYTKTKISPPPPPIIPSHKKNDPVPVNVESRPENPPVKSDENTIQSVDSLPEQHQDNLHFTQQGLATFYANKFQGHRTAFGERYDKNKFTAAHLTLAHNTMVKVTNIENGKSVMVRINDRGPHGANRIIDLSMAAAKELNIVRQGIGKVLIEVFAKDE